MLSFFLSSLVIQGFSLFFIFYFMLLITAFFCPVLGYIKAVFSVSKEKMKEI